MRKHLKLLGLVVGPVVLLAIIAAVPGPPSTEFTRGLLRTTNQAEAQAYLGASGGGSSTNVQNNFFSTNIYSTNITAITVNNETNIYNVAKGGHLTVYSNLTALKIGPSKLVRTDSDTNLAAVTIGSGVTFDGTTLSASGGGGSGVSTAVTALGLSSTNVTGFDCSTNNMTYTLTLAGHYLFGSSTFANLQQKTTNMFFTLALQQDSSGGWVPKFTNTIVAWADGVQPVIKTNASAVSYLYFHTHLFTNSMLVGSPNLNVQ